MRAFTVASEVGYTVPNAAFRPAQAAFGNTMTAFIRGVGQYDFDFAFEPGVASTSTTCTSRSCWARRSSCSTSIRSRCCAGRRARSSGAARSAARYAMSARSLRVTTQARRAHGRRLRSRRRPRVLRFRGQRQPVGPRDGLGDEPASGYQDVIDFTCVHPELSGDLPIQPVNKETAVRSARRVGPTMSAVAAVALGGERRLRDPVDRRLPEGEGGAQG